MTAAGFADRLILSNRRLGSPLCVGLDPFADKVPALFGPAGSLRAVEDFCLAVLEEIAGQVASVKPQIGLFEPWGADGFGLVQSLCAAARDRGLLVILDAKRGDIGSTAEGYARACLGPGSAFGADCVTVNPYLGLDSLEPFVARAAETGTGVAVLVRTSNPGARDFQDLDAGGAPLWVRVAEALRPLQDRLAGETGWSSLMVVAGATWPDEARRLRAILPRSLFLVPGYGAQGGAAQDAVAGFVHGPQGLEGGAVNSSRAILYPPAASQASSLASWRGAIREAIAAARADLAQATGSDARI